MVRNLFRRLCWASGVAQRIKMLVSKSEKLSSVPETHTAGENQLPQLFPNFHYALWHAHMYMSTHTHTRKINKGKWKKVVLVSSSGCNVRHVCHVT